jgi:PAS domain S-box-containing protein
MFAKLSEIKAQNELCNQKLQACLARFHAIMTNSPHGILIVDMNSKVLFANPAAAAIFGCKMKELLDKQFDFSVEPDKTVELKLRSRDGETVAVEAWAIETEWNADKACFIALHDITERKKNEQELRKLYRAMMESPVMVMVTDAQGNIEYVNPRFTETTGYTFAEVAGKNPRFLKSDRTSPEVHNELWAAIACGKVWRGEFINSKKNGELYIESASIAPIMDANGVITNFIAVKEDITERKRAEEKFRGLLESAPDAMVIVDGKGEICIVNSQTEKLFGYERGELYGQKVEILIPERFRSRHVNERADYLSNPRVRQLGTVSKLFGRHKDGREFPVDIGLSPLHTDGDVLVIAAVRDITERMRVEEALRESEDRFRATFNQAAVGIGHMSPNGRWLRINQKYCDITGYTEEELKALTISEITHPDDREMSMKHFQLMLEGKLDNYSLEKRYIRKDGSTIWVNLIVSMVFDAERKPRFAMGVVADITRRKRAEEALRFSEERFRALFRDNPLMIVTLDADWRMLSVNPTCASQLGYTIEELAGQSVLKLFREDDRSVVDEQLRKCMQNPDQVHRWQFRKIRKDGEMLWVEETAQVVYDLNGMPNLLVVCQDITERKRAEDEIKATSRQNELILTSAGEGILGLDMQGNHTFVNSSAAAMLGYDVNELIGKNSHATWHHSKPDGSSYPAEECPIFAAYKDGTLHSGKEMFWRKDGTGLPVAFTSRPILSDGETVGAVLTFNDITEQKRLEEEIERLNIALVARAAELEAANIELESFNYTVAHDLRNPLNAVSSYCQAFKEQCCDTLSGQCQRYIQETYDGTLRMNRLIEALLNFSRLAHVETHWATVDLSAMAHEIAAELQLGEPERRVRFLIADGVSADGDAALLRIVMGNLFGNAWEYSGTRDEGVIEFGTTDVDGNPAYFVCDNGVGFDMGNAGKLFVPFQRLPGAEECRGFGIGQATVERIIRRHGGRVWAEGEPGKGACVYFTLSADR